MKDFSIAGRMVGDEYPPLIIVEVGINHDGSLEKAMELVDAAAVAGAELVKFQCHITEDEMVPTDMTPGDISSERLWDIIKRCELNEDEEKRLKKYTEERGMIYLSTPFSRAAADRLQRLGVEAFKIGSGECNNLPLIEHIAKFQKPIILSTGMNDIKSIKRSVDLIQQAGTPFALMHCTSLYPTPYEKVRLGGILDLKNTFKNTVVGLSDHSIGIWTSLGAVSLGASLLEKHFTVSRSWPGPDTSLSIEPNELSDLINGSKAIWMAQGGRKTVLQEEQPVIEFAYASVVSIKKISAGEQLSDKNIWVKRPGTGHFLADKFTSLIGMTAARDIAADVQITPDDITLID